MPASVVFIGNDIHGPYDEMASNLVRGFRQALKLDACRVISIQSFKPIGSRAVGEHVVSLRSRRWRQLGRALQLVELLMRIVLTRRSRTRIVHLVGNGNTVLNTALALLCSLTGRRFLLSPLGRIQLPLFGLRVWVTLPHETLADSLRESRPSLASRVHVLSPYVSFEPDSASEVRRSREEPPLSALFCSTPNKASEFEERGIHFLARIAGHSLAETIEITILNRHPQIAEDLNQLAQEAGGGLRLKIDNRTIDDMRAYMLSFDALLIPYQIPGLVQVPLSALEAMSLGIPCLTIDKTALAGDVEEFGAGETFHDLDSFFMGLTKLRSNYQRASFAARRLVSERYSQDVSISQLHQVYDALGG